MSTIVNELTFLGRASEKSGSDSIVSYRSASDARDWTGELVKSNGIRRTEHESSKSHKRVLRRFHGFVIEFHEQTARVALVQEGKTFPYDLPAEQLRKQGIELQNQPFQMDEVEVETGDGRTMVGYQFLALAKTSDAYIETLELDEERIRKRDLIFREFEKTKS